MRRKPAKPLTPESERERKARNQRESRARRARERVTKLELYARTEHHDAIRQYARKIAT